MTLLKTMILVAGLGVVALAQGQGLMADQARAMKVIAIGLYPPDLIMRHQQELGITDAQRAAISRAVTAFQSEVSELQWNLQSGQQQLQQSLDTYPIKPEESLALAERVLEMESAFKLAHFRLLIATKNALTEEQVTRIDARIEEKRGKLRP